MIQRGSGVDMSLIDSSREREREGGREDGRNMQGVVEEEEKETREKQEIGGFIWSPSFHSGHACCDRVAVAQLFYSHKVSNGQRAPGIRHRGGRRGFVNVSGARVGGPDHALHGRNAHEQRKQRMLSGVRATAEVRGSGEKLQVCRGMPPLRTPTTLSTTQNPSHLPILLCECVRVEQTPRRA